MYIFLTLVQIWWHGVGPGVSNQWAPFLTQIKLKLALNFFLKTFVHSKPLKYMTNIISQVMTKFHDPRCTWRQIIAEIHTKLVDLRKLANWWHTLEFAMTWTPNGLKYV